MKDQFYLKKLIIQNFATFKNQTIHFRPGFNAIIGETGSGKSLVLDALQIILGGRADKKIVRKDTEYSLIEASFYCGDVGILNYLETEGFPVENNDVIIKRLIYNNGSTKTYINHLSCTVSFLNCFSKRYIDLIGQFENQKLLSEAYQLLLLDHYGKLTTEVESFKNTFRNYKNQLSSLEELQKSKSHREQRIDYLNYQLNEIDKLNPSSQDEEDLLRKKNLLINMEKNQKTSLQLKSIFEGGEGIPGLLSQIALVNGIMTKNKEIFSDILDDVTVIEDQVHYLALNIERKLEHNLDQLELEGIIERLDLYQRLKKKFGGSVESILQARIDFEDEKNHLAKLEINSDEIQLSVQTLHKELITKAKDLHIKRIKSAQSLSKELTSHVRKLKMTGATIKMHLDELDDPYESGISRITFLAETNPGEGYFKVKDIASGGELSRILLAVRQILSSYDSISIFLFDEIDTGIGGETANCIGQALEQVANNGQVIAITHLPQIAQFASSLIMVQKEIQGSQKQSRTESSVKEIVGSQIKKEVRLMAQLA